MTINLVAGTQQTGAAYRVMAILYLPSLWNAAHVRGLQIGLARALSSGLALPPAEVHVITTVVESGHVVEHGETQEW